MLVAQTSYMLVLFQFNSLAERALQQQQLLLFVPFFEFRLFELKYIQSRGGESVNIPKLSLASITLSTLFSLSFLFMVSHCWKTKIKHLQRPNCKVSNLFSSARMFSALCNDSITIDLLSSAITKSNSGNNLHLRFLWKYKTIHSSSQSYCRSESFSRICCKLSPIYNGKLRKPSNNNHILQPHYYKFIVLRPHPPTH